jgi:opacity protein-like surface antigen
MKKFLFLILSAVLVSGAYSYEFKIMGGITFSKPDQVMQPAIPEYRLNAASKTGFLAGGGVELSLTKNIAFEIDGLYFQKGCKIKVYDLGQFSNYINFEFNELSFPVLLKISIFSGTSPYILGGGEFAFVLSHKLDGWYDIAQETKKTNYGLVFGVGFRKKIEKIFIFIEGRYHIGLQDLSRGEGYYYLPFKKIRSFVLMSGFSF